VNLKNISKIAIYDTRCQKNVKIFGPESFVFLKDLCRKWGFYKKMEKKSSK